MAHTPDPKEEAAVEAIALSLSSSAGRTPEDRDYDSAREIVDALDSLIKARVSEGVAEGFRNQARRVGF